MLENGEYPILIGASSQDIRLEGRILVSDQEAYPAPYQEKTLAEYRNVASLHIARSSFEDTIGGPVPAEPEKYPLTLESPFFEFRGTPGGRTIYSVVLSIMGKGLRQAQHMPEGPEKAEALRRERFVIDMIRGNNLRAMAQNSGGRIDRKTAEAMVALANGKPGKAAKILKKQQRHIPLPCEEQE